MHSRCRQWMFSRKLILGSWLDGPLWKPGVTLDSSSLLREDRGSRHPSLAILRPHAHTCTYTYTLANWQTLGSLCCQWQDEVWPLKCNNESMVHIQFVCMYQLESVSRLQRCLLSVLKVQQNSWYVRQEGYKPHTRTCVWAGELLQNSLHSCPWHWETQMCKYSLCCLSHLKARGGTNSPAKSFW